MSDVPPAVVKPGRSKPPKEGKVPPVSVAEVLADLEGTLLYVGTTSAGTPDPARGTATVADGLFAVARSILVLAKTIREVSGK